MMVPIRLYELFKLTCTRVPLDLCLGLLVRESLMRSFPIGVSGQLPLSTQVTHAHTHACMHVYAYIRTYMCVCYQLFHQRTFSLLICVVNILSSSNFFLPLSPLPYHALLFFLSQGLLDV